MIKFSATMIATLVAASVNAATVDLRILETTDLHSNMMDFDYYKDAPTEKFGLVRTASLIKAARQEAANSVLVDNGDLIQGSPLGDYMAAKGLKDGDVHPVYKALNTLDYAVGNLGNHEFITASITCIKRFQAQNSPTSTRTSLMPKPKSRFLRRI